MKGHGTYSITPKDDDDIAVGVYVTMDDKKKQTQNLRAVKMFDRLSATLPKLTVSEVDEYIGRIQKSIDESV